MTISQQYTTDIAYIGNGVQTQFPIPFPFFTPATDVRAMLVTASGETRVETPLVYNRDFTVSASPGVGGSLTMVVPPAVGVTLLIYLAVAILQELDLHDQGRIPAERLERSLDKLTMISQQHHASLERAVQAPIGAGDPRELVASLFAARSEAVASAAGAAKSKGEAAESAQAATEQAEGAAASALAAQEAAEQVELDISEAIAEIQAEGDVQVARVAEVFPVPAPDLVGKPLALVPQVAGGFNWTPTVEAVVATRNITVNIGDLQKTIDALPKTLMEWVTITVNPGTYSGEIHISRFQGPGQLTITSGVDTAATTHNVVRVLIEKCTLSRIDIIGFNATATYDIAFYTSTSSSTSVYTGCSSTAGLPSTAGNFGFSAYASGHCIVSKCVASNKSRGVNADRTSVAIEGTTGSNNAVAMRANPGGIIFVEDNVLINLTGTTQMSRARGIFVFADGNTIGTRVWTSAEYTPVANTALYAIHNIPNLNIDSARVEIFAKFAVGINGYSVGEVIRFGIFNYSTVVGPLPIALTNVSVTTWVASTFALKSRTDGTINTALPVANMRLFFRIWY